VILLKTAFFFNINVKTNNEKRERKGAVENMREERNFF